MECTLVETGRCTSSNTEFFVSAGAADSRTAYVEDLQSRVSGSWQSSSNSSLKRCRSARNRPGLLGRKHGIRESPAASIAA